MCALWALCVWVLTLDVLWSWILLRIWLKLYWELIYGTCQKHAVQILSSVLPSSPLTLIDMKNNFLRRTKMAPTASWRPWIKTNFDSHIVWMLAGLFALSPSLSVPLSLLTKETDTPPTPPSVDFSHSPLVLLKIFANRCCQTCRHGGWLLKSFHANCYFKKKFSKKKPHNILD